ncbi:MAG: GNAT family N-acetyltransferase [Leucothrix sp.]
MVDSTSIAFKRADLQRDMASCIEFRRDSFQINYGAEKSFDVEMGLAGESYAASLFEFQAKFPDGVIHVWRDEIIVGQIEFYIEALFTDKAFIPMFYLIPSQRGSGIGSMMHDYLIETLRNSGCNGARIPVSSSNDRGVAFYKKHGWRYAKPDLRNSHVDLYQLNF